MCTNIGYLLGAILAAILVNRIPQELLYGMCQILAGLSLACAPWPEDVYFYSTALFMRGIFSGVLETGMVPQPLVLFSTQHPSTLLHHQHHLFPYQQ